MEGAHLKNKPSHLRAALRAYVPLAPGQEATLLAVAEQLRRSPTSSTSAVAEALLGITDVPDETWRGPLPPLEGAERALSIAIDRLSAEWNLTGLHRLVALRRVAWAASQLARVVEKSLDEESRGK
jgi:hypothetical protein